MQNKNLLFLYVMLFVCCCYYLRPQKRLLVFPLHKLQSTVNAQPCTFCNFEVACCMLVYEFLSQLSFGIKLKTFVGIYNIYPPVRYNQINTSLFVDDLSHLPWLIITSHPRWDLAKWLERLTANAQVATVLGSIPASVGTVESEGRQMKQCWILYEQKEKNPPQKNI